MRIINRLLAACCLAGLLLAPATPVNGAETSASSSEKDISELSFSKVVKRAQTAYSNKQFNRAIRLLVRAYSMRSNARLLFNIAKSYEKKDLCGAALVYYRAYINHPGTEKKLMDAANGKMEGADECEAYSKDLAGRLIVGTTPEGARVKVDGKPYGKTPIEVAPLESGTHELVIEKDGYESVSFNLDMTSGEKTEIHQILQEKTEETNGGGNGGGNGGPDPGPEPRRTSLLWPIHPAAIALGAGGLGGLTVGAIYDLALIPSTDAKRRKADQDSDKFDRLSEQRDTQETIALTGYIGGGLLLASGLTWHAIDVVGDRNRSGSASGPRQRAPIRWSLSASPRSVGVQLRFY